VVCIGVPSLLCFSARAQSHHIKGFHPEQFTSFFLKKDFEGEGKVGIYILSTAFIELDCPIIPRSEPNYLDAPYLK